MLYVSFGMRKSGSTLAHELARGLCEALGHPQHRREEAIDAGRVLNFIGGREPLGMDGAIERLLRSVPHEQIVVLKTHDAPTPMIGELLRSGQMRGHAVCRDPRDNVLSLIDAGRRGRERGQGSGLDIADMDAAVAECERGLRSFEEWCALPGILATDYDEVAFDSEGFVRRLMAQLGFEAERVDVKALCARVKSERFTQFNQGLPRRHREDLSLDATLGLTARFADAIERHMAARIDAVDRVLLAQARRIEVPQSFVGVYAGERPVTNAVDAQAGAIRRPTRQRSRWGRLKAWIGRVAGSGVMQSRGRWQ